jgi:6,7-dimethyl-8-ribityllumazine synthase
MLQQVTSATQSAAGMRFAIIASKYNARFVDAMLEAAQRTLLEANAAAVKVIRVPGAFEIPAVASALARNGTDPFSALICLGVILRGETTHADHIGEAVSHALAQLQVQHAFPIIHEVLLLENTSQAEARCLGSKHNRGTEAALTAIDMAHVMKALAGR